MPNHCEYLTRYPLFQRAEAIDPEPLGGAAAAAVAASPAAGILEAQSSQDQEAKEPPKKKKNRCLQCKKKVGLTGENILFRVLILSDPETECIFATCLSTYVLINETIPMFLSGFTCRCGGLYCSIHRYSDKHECNFDYKKQGAEEISKSNPVVMAQKVEKI